MSALQEQKDITFGVSFSVRRKSSATFCLQVSTPEPGSYSRHMVCHTKLDLWRPCFSRSFKGHAVIFWPYFHVLDNFLLSVNTPFQSSGLSLHKSDPWELFQRSGPLSKRNSFFPSGGTSRILFVLKQSLRPTLGTAFIPTSSPYAYCAWPTPFLAITSLLTTFWSFRRWAYTHC